MGLWPDPVVALLTFLGPCHAKGCVMRMQKFPFRPSVGSKHVGGWLVCTALLSSLHVQRTHGGKESTRLEMAPNRDTFLQPTCSGVPKPLLPCTAWWDAPGSAFACRAQIESSCMPLLASHRVNATLWESFVSKFTL